MNRFRVWLLLLLFLLVAALRTGPKAVQALQRSAWPGASVYCDASPVPGRPALLAIVIDDLKTGAPGFKELMALNIPLTFALFPDQPGAGALAKQVTARGHEVILHLPMDAGKVNPVWYAGRALSAAQTDEEIQALVGEWFRKVPQARGMNNHMGTLATADERVMRAVIAEARSRSKFVLDSMTTEATVMPKVAVEMGVPCLQRSLFLDHEPGKEVAAEQLEKLSDWAIRHGAAIGIGHVGQGREGTAQALEEMLPQLRDRGIQLVTLSELLRLQGQE